MERIKDLTRYQKGILILLAVMMAGFGIVYGVVSSRVGFLYQNEILIPEQDGGNTVYTGTIQKQDAEFVVAQDGTITFRHGRMEYGPYTVREDPTAIPAEYNRGDQMIGVEILEGNKSLFRGGCLFTAQDRSHFELYTEDGWYPGIIITATTSNGVTIDGQGNIVDHMEPGIFTLLRLYIGPELTHKGQWLGWFGGVFISLLIAASILFADELFHIGLMFRVRDAYQVQPSDWEIAQRYIGWTVLVIMALVVYCQGLR